MYKYNVKIQKVSGRLNESVLPSKNLVVKSKTKKSDKEVFAEASKFFKEKYGLVIESADVTLEGDTIGLSAIYPREHVAAMAKFAKEFGKMSVSDFLSSVPNATEFIDETNVSDKIADNASYYGSESGDVMDEVTSYSTVGGLIEDGLISSDAVFSYYTR